ncbi:MAG: cyclic nucleotide-binding domain-containing protein, partial [Chloroflexi bacterium]|nr:cyclic nucleotide-binding domain-containing protein [Chloroflexota bacterium]
MDQPIDTLRHVSFCADLPEATLRALVAIAVPLGRPAGTLIQIEGEPAEAMYIVAQGRVKITRLAANGREQVLHVAASGHHFNTVPIFDGGPCPANAEALTDVRLLMLPLTYLREVVESHPL